MNITGGRLGVIVGTLCTCRHWFEISRMLFTAALDVKEPMDAAILCPFAMPVCVLADVILLPVVMVNKLRRYK